MIPFPASSTEIGPPEPTSFSPRVAYKHLLSPLLVITADGPPSFLTVIGEAAPPSPRLRLPGPPTSKKLPLLTVLRRWKKHAFLLLWPGTRDRVPSLRMIGSPSLQRPRSGRIRTRKSVPPAVKWISFCRLKKILSCHITLIILLGLLFADRA